LIPGDGSAYSTWSRRFVGAVWATHNDSAAIHAALGNCLQRLSPSERGLNVGSGSSPRRPSVVNIDLVRHQNVDVIAAAERLPFADQVFSLVMSQEVLEHVADPLTAAKEMRRVLGTGGTLYCQAPFIIGFHPGPHDYWRFTREGLATLARQAGFLDPDVRLAVGPGTGIYRIAVEFWATACARLVPSLYRPSKAMLAVLCYPLKWCDAWLASSPEADRIAGGYYVLAKPR
jgi:SAM-dependent methyltransferase